MIPKAITDEIICSFCNKILPDFRDIMNNLKELHTDLSPNDFAMNLMELGRGQMSEIFDPGEQDVDIMTRYTESLDLDDFEKSCFSAYAGGCILGLVMIDEVASEELRKAFRLIEAYAHREFHGSN